MNSTNEKKTREKGYSVIYVDVPWEEKNWSLNSTRDLAIRNWAAEGALLLLWAPNALLADGLSVMREWGFTYAGLIAWRKPNGEIENLLPCSVCEYMIIGRKGSVKVDHLFRNMLYDGPASGGGYKPQAFRRILGGAGHYAFGESGRYLDVFGRYWQNRFPEYERGNWEGLVDF